MAGGGGGGAWKVAYADFVTAMMALFMVLWISAQDQEILLATSQYFQSPFNSPLDASTGVLSMAASGGPDNSMEKVDPSSMVDLSMLNKLAANFTKALDIDQNDSDAPVEVKVTNEGLKLTVFDRNDRPLFEEKSDKFTKWGDFVIQNLAWGMDRYKFRIRIDGHTAAGPSDSDGEYSGWELSSDRANATRRALQYYAVEPERFERVTGFADTQPLPGRDPESELNQRIEISLVVLEPLKKTAL